MGVRFSDQAIKEYKEIGLHISVSKAKDRYGELAVAAGMKEVQQMIEKGVWDFMRPIDAKERMKTKRFIKSFMFYKEKFTANNKFDKLKARLVAGGNFHNRQDYKDVSSPTIATEAVFMILAQAVQQERYIATVDIGGAYLNASIGDQDVYMVLEKDIADMICKINNGFSKYVDVNGCIYVKLKKALYGCIEAARQWYHHLAYSLEEMGFKRSEYEPCVFSCL